MVRSEPSGLLVRDVRRAGGSERLDVLVDDGRVAAIVPTGHDHGQDTPVGEVVDAAGRVLVPGLGDAHVHVTQWALARRHVDVIDASSARQVAALLGEAVDVHLAAAGEGTGPDVLQGARMRMELFPDTPHRRMLDETTGTVPVVVTNIDLHTAWANTAALRLLDVDSDDGLVREDACYAVLERLADVPVAVRDRAVAEAMEAAAAKGVTAVKDFEFTDAVADWRRRMAAGRPPVRVETTVYEGHLDAAIDRGLGTGQVVAGTNGLLRSGHLKLFADGALNSGTAWCHEPGTGEPTGESGHRVMDTGRMRSLVEDGWRHGIAPTIHAIGDKAVDQALDVIEHVGCPGRIEHVQLVRRVDDPRLAWPDLVLSVQPAHITDDRDVTDRVWDDRADRAWPLASLAAAGATLVFGSDAPVSPLDPWAGIASAVTRTDDHRPAWQPAECLDRRTALRAAAWGRSEVAVGDVADLAVVDDDPLDCADRVLREMTCFATVMDGHLTHHAVG